VHIWVIKLFHSNSIQISSVLVHYDAEIEFAVIAIEHGNITLERILNGLVNILLINPFGAVNVNCYHNYARFN